MPRPYHADGRALSLHWTQPRVALTTEDHAPTLTCYPNLEVILEFSRREGGMKEAEAGRNFLSADAV